MPDVVSHELPVNFITAFKLFKIDSTGALRPLYVNTSAVVPMNTWLTYEEPVADRKEVNGKVYIKTKINWLRYLPGWHSFGIPYAKHIGEKRSDGKLYRRPDEVWAKVRISISKILKRKIAETDDIMFIYDHYISELLYVDKILTPEDIKSFLLDPLLYNTEITTT